MKILIKSLLLLISLLGLTPLFAQSLQTTPLSNEYLRLRLTHTLFQGVIASTYAESAQKFDAKVLANQAYLQTFLNEWSKKIDSGQYRSSEALFADLLNGDSYLSKYSHKWASIYQFSTVNGGVKGAIDLGDMKTQFLGQVMVAERKFKDIDQQVQYLLQAASIYLVANGQEYQLAQVIAAPFLKSSNEKTRKYAEEVLAAVPARQKIQKAIMLYDVATLMIGGSRFLSSNPFILKPIQTTKIGLSTTKLINSGHKLYNSSKGIINPILSRMTTMHWSMLASASVHTGAMTAGTLYITDNFTSNSTGQINSQPPLVSIGLLWNSFNENYADSFALQGYDNFKPQFKLGHQTELIKSVQQHLQSNTPIDYGNTLLRAEKFAKIDQREDEDQFAMDFVHHRYERMKQKIDQLFTKPVTAETIEEFRQISIEDALVNYKRDYPNLTSTLLNWGGNCVASTMLMISLLEPHKERLAAAGYKLVVSLFTDHIEAGLMNGNELISLVEGLQTKNIVSTIHEPKFLMILLLRNYDSAISSAISNTKNLAHVKIKVTDLKFDEIGIANSNQKDKRYGVLEKFRLGDIKPGTAKYTDDEIPYAATQSYSRTVQGSHSLVSFSRLGRRSYNNPAKPKPKFTISLVFEPQKKELLDFIHDQVSDTVRVYNEATYTELTQLARQPKMDDAKFREILREKNKTKIADLWTNPLVQKFYIDPSLMGLDHFLQIKDEDIERHDQFLIELLAVKNQLIYREISNTTGMGSFSTLLSLIYKTDMSTDLTLKVNKELDILFKIIKNPRHFLEVYNQATPRMRNHLLTRFISQTHSKQMSPSYYNQTRGKIRDYLNSMDQIKVELRKENSFICNPIKVNLPRVSNSWPWAYNFSKENCQTDFIEKPAETERIVGENHFAQKTNMLELKISTLIELTVTFGRGLQVWTEDVVNAFIDGHYEKILVDRPSSIIQVKNVLLSEPQLMKEPRFNRLKEFLSTVDAHTQLTSLQPASKLDCVYNGEIFKHKTSLWGLCENGMTTILSCDNGTLKKGNETRKCSLQFY